jgi:allantoate deiminase
MVMERIETLASISDEPGRITRTFCSPGMKRANELVGSWMREAGMTVRTDAIGNLIGEYAGAAPGVKTLLLGSHLDTVREAGKFDGPLGVLTAIACVQHLHESKRRLPFAVEVIAFADEEGVRFQTAYLGSKVIAGSFNPEDLKRKDADGVMMAEAIRRFGGDPDELTVGGFDSKKLLGYVEVHIEQGPVLEQKDQPIGVVTAIAGQTRVQVTFTGRAGHAGTTPMNLRRDALCAAAEFVLEVEGVAKGRDGLVATVGAINARPGVGNVIPGEIRLSLDVRHAEDAVRNEAIALLQVQGRSCATNRKIDFDWQLVQEIAAVACDPRLSMLLTESVTRFLGSAVSLASGAGHDAAIMSAITPVAMLFVRCKNGLSHHPDESASLEDARMAISVMNDFIMRLAQASA